VRFGFKFICDCLRKILILKTSMENYQAFDVDRPILLIIDESLNNLKQSLRCGNIWMSAF